MAFYYSFVCWDCASHHGGSDRQFDRSICLFVWFVCWFGQSICFCFSLWRPFVFFLFLALQKLVSVSYCSSASHHRGLDCLLGRTICLLVQTFAWSDYLFVQFVLFYLFLLLTMATLLLITQQQAASTNGSNHGSGRVHLAPGWWERKSSQSTGSGSTTAVTRTRTTRRLFRSLLEWSHAWNNGKEEETTVSSCENSYKKNYEKSPPPPGGHQQQWHNLWHQLLLPPPTRSGPRWTDQWVQN